VQLSAVFSTNSGASKASYLGLVYVSRRAAKKTKKPQFVQLTSNYAKNKNPWDL
jgi:hypothetical protein